MAFVDKQIEQVSFDVHMQNKSMWLGSKQKSQIPYFKYDTKSNTFTPAKITCSPARLKLIDEVVANAIDHFIECNNTQYKVTKIYADMGTLISISNNGPGFQLSWNGTTWSVESALTNLMAGSNVTKKSKQTAGTNGVGLKGVVTHAKYFRIRTVDPRVGVTYTQVITDCMKKIEPPTLESMIDNEPVTPERLEQMKNLAQPRVDELASKSYTKIDFMLEDNLFSDNDIPSLKEDVKNYVMSQLALSTMFINGHAKGMEVKFNNTKLIPNMKALPVKYSAYTKVLCSNGTYWNIVLGFSNVPDRFKLQNISVINGIVLPEGGDHITRIRKQVVSVCQTELNKLQEKHGLKPDNKRFYGKIFISTFASINDPDWRGQVKDHVNIKKEDVREITMDKEFLLKFWNVIKDDIEKTITSMKIKAESKKSKTRMKSNLHTPAADIKKKSVSCTLFIPEGDSAQSMIRGGLAVCNEISRTSCGIFNITGVPMNVRKQVKAKKKEANNQDDSDYLPNDYLLSNERFIELMACIGLPIVPDRSDMFDNTPTGDSEFSKLHYKTVILTVDQDYDGRGHICGLILNFFALFYPNLIKRNFVKYLRTPLIRVFNKDETRRCKKGVFYNFYSDVEYRRWVDSLPKEDITLVDDSVEPGSKWYVVYYKGLAGHNEGEEVNDIFLNFKKNVVTIHWDDLAANKFEAYYGKDVSMRKKLLSTPFSIPIEYYEKLKLGSITCSEHLDYETRAYQKYVLSRKLKCCYDGLVPSQRKVLYYALKKLGRDNKATRVVDLASGSVEPTKYHHGPKSLEDVVIRMAQKFVGSNTIPYFIGLGEFGSREFGRNAKHAGASRYTRVRLNKKLTDKLLPAMDFQIVPYVYDEGSKCEPKYLIPIIPMSIIDSTTTPACGWKIDNWGRDVGSVFESVRNMINGVEVSDLFGKPHSTQDMKIQIGVKYTEHCVGSYSFDEQKMEITISQLPLMVWYGPYATNLREKPYIKNVSDSECKRDIVKLVVKLIPDKLPFPIKTPQDIEKLLDLGKICRQILNMTDDNGDIKEYKSYTDVISDWFTIRKRCYELRLEREQILLRAKIRVQENILKFITSKTNFVDMTKLQAENMLEENTYQKVNSGLLKNPGCIENSRLEKMIFDFAATYDYLFKQSKFKETKEGEKKVKDKLENLQKKLEDLLNISYKTCWLKELDELEEVIKLGMKTNWTYGRNERFD
jgi:DNA topoisomerase-2